MPVYKDDKRNTWFCKCNYKDWLGESKSKMKRGFATKMYIPTRQSTLHGVLVHGFRRYSARFPVISA